MTTLPSWLGALVPVRITDKIFSLEHVGQVGPFSFFEHPLKGDEAPLLVRFNHMFYYSPFWDVPTLDEVMDD